MLKPSLAFCLALIAVAGPAFCQTNADFGPNAGSDGTLALAYNTNATINLGAAPAAAWDSPGTGNGVYDPQKWAVVFKYKSVTISQYATLTFINNPSTAPVVWLVSGDVNINGGGTVDVSGHSSATQGTNAIPGPGGFRGGSGAQTGRASGGGFGVGGGNNTNGSYAFAGGSYSTVGPVSNAASPGQPYGNSQILPLIGGSGGSGTSDRTGDGGAGGGAILIVATGTITVNGAIYANGGNYAWNDAAGGSGGSIRLVAATVAGSGVLRAVGGIGYSGASGGYGRIRVESLTANTSIATAGTYSSAAPDNPVKIWPDSTVPTVSIVSIGQAAAPTDPHASLGAADVRFNTTTPQTVTLATTNVPSSGTVMLRVTPQYDLAFSVPATFVSDDGTTATWTAQVTFPANYCALQARATVSAVASSDVARVRAMTASPTARIVAPVGVFPRAPFPIPLTKQHQGPALPLTTAPKNAH